MMEGINLLEKLVEMSPGMEIWWDSSPVIFESWSGGMLEKALPEHREILKLQLHRMFNRDHPTRQLFRGVTTNPALSLQAIQNDPSHWEGIAGGIISDNPGIDRETLFWLLYKQVVKRGSDMYLPLFENSGYREGYLSGQVDPRSSFDKEAMLRQALDLAKLNPNVMIKVPGSSQGYEVIEELTARGISTNNTLTFVLPQLLDCAQSVRRGLETARMNNVDLSRWRSVITHMESRYGDLGGLREFAAEKGITLSEGEVRLAELAIFKKAYKYLIDHKLPSKMLSCSLRLGPTVDGIGRIWHLEEKSGAGIVVTCPPTFIDQVINFPDQRGIVFEKDRILKDIPEDVLGKLLRIPYFERAYSTDGYTRKEYDTHPALVRTAAQFSKATEEMVAFAGKCLDKRFNGEYEGNHENRHSERNQG
jgi:transaldolase